MRSKKKKIWKIQKPDRFIGKRVHPKGTFRILQWSTVKNSRARERALFLLKYSLCYTFSMANIHEGNMFPGFTSRVFNGNDIAIPKDYAGKYLIVYFYPKDMTSGCTREGIEFTKLLSEFKKLNAEIVGVSVDSPESHNKFCAVHGLGVTLLTDEDGKLGTRLGILRPSGSHERTTFILDPEGNIVKIYESVTVGGHAQNVLDFLTKTVQ